MSPPTVVNAEQLAGRRLQACHDCDLLVDLRNLAEHGHADCPRCGTVLANHTPDSLNRTLAFSLTGMMLYLPAVLLPVMTINILGHANANTMINGVLQLVHDGYWWMAFMVAFGSLIVPLCLLLLLFSICLLSRLRTLPKIQILLLKTHHHLKHWGMLDVYMLSLLVTIIKMKDLGDLQMGPGLYAFVALLILMTLAQSQFDSQQCWNRLEDHKR
jgi:paraquat-inducible protein A